MNFDPNNLFYFMLKKYSEWDFSDKLIICNEGGSRSSKTWDTFHLIYFICIKSKKPLEIYILRKTLAECRDKTFDDFKRFMRTIGCYDSDSHTSFPKPNYTINDCVIKFRGLDDEKDTEGYPSDIVFLNEALEVENESQISGVFMRCRKLFISDWNPKFTMHWIFNWEKRSNCYFTKTTYKNNKHLETSIIREIESYEPTEENIKNGTANEWRWNVYGKGLRCNKSGLVFRNVTWHDEMTKDTEKYFYGLDFGNTTGIYAFSRGCISNNEIWFDCPIYGSFANRDDIQFDSESGCKNFYTAFKSWYGNRKDEVIIVSDSAQPQKINMLNVFCERDNLNCKFVPVKKFPGCIKWRIDVINQFKLNLVKSFDVVKEQENYTYKEIRGIKLDEPIDDFNHFFDACGYSIQYQPFAIKR